MLSFPKTQALTVVMLTWFVKRILTWLLVMLVLPEVQEKKNWALSGRVSAVYLISSGFTPPKEPV